MSPGGGAEPHGWAGGGDTARGAHRDEDGHVEQLGRRLEDVEEEGLRGRGAMERGAPSVGHQGDAQRHAFMGFGVFFMCWVLSIKTSRGASGIAAPMAPIPGTHPCTSWSSWDLALVPGLVSSCLALEALSQPFQALQV